MAVIEVTKENFEKEVKNSATPVLIDFNAGWCGPCRMLRPVLEEIASEQDKVRIVSVDIDEEDEMELVYEFFMDRLFEEDGDEH